MTNWSHPLISVCLVAHATAASTNNPVSSQVFSAAAGGSGDFGKACIAAIATLGGEHAPIAEARRAIYGQLDVYEALADGRRIPGWGNSFYRYRSDPAWDKVAKLLQMQYNEHYMLIERITGELHSVGKMLYPNAAAYTAVCSEIAGVPHGAEQAVLLIGRLPAWADLWEQRA